MTIKCPSGSCDIEEGVAVTWAAKVVGSRKKPSELLKQASRENGKKGGRPKQHDTSSELNLTNLPDQVTKSLM